jgi:hypothetical protein
MNKNNQLNGLIARTLGSKAALLRAMQRSNTPIVKKTLHNWCADPGSIRLRQLMNLSHVMQIPLCEVINAITIKHEGDE